AGALARALDQPGDIGDHELAFIEASDTKGGCERREWIVRDLRPGARKRGEQARLTGVGKAGESDVGDEPQLQLELALLPPLPVLSGTPRARAAPCESRN